MADDLNLYVPYQEPERDSMTAIATPAQIRYAEQLRLQIRQSYLARRTPSPTLWLVHVD